MSFMEVFDILLTLAEHPGLHPRKEFVIYIIWCEFAIQWGTHQLLNRAVHLFKNIAKGTTGPRY